MKPYLKLETHPLADPKNVVKGDKYRITVLTEHLLRLEYSEDGEFIDAASQTVVNRDFPAVEFSVKDTGDELELRTKYLQLNYNKKAFSANGLSCKTTAVGISSVLINIRICSCCQNSGTDQIQNLAASFFQFTNIRFGYFHGWDNRMVIGYFL